MFQSCILGSRVGLRATCFRVYTSAGERTSIRRQFHTPLLKGLPLLTGGVLSYVRLLVLVLHGCPPSNYTAVTLLCP